MQYGQTVLISFVVFISVVVPDYSSPLFDEYFLFCQREPLVTGLLMANSTLTLAALINHIFSLICEGAHSPPSIKTYQLAINIIYVDTNYDVFQWNILLYSRNVYIIYQVVIIIYSKFILYKV